MSDERDGDDEPFKEEMAVEVFNESFKHPQWRQAVIESVDKRLGISVRRPVNSKDRWDPITIPNHQVSTRLRCPGGSDPMTPRRPPNGDTASAANNTVPSGEKRGLVELTCSSCDKHFTRTLDLAIHLINDHGDTDISLTQAMINIIIEYGDIDEALRILSKSAVNLGDLKAIEGLGRQVQRSKFTDISGSQARKRTLDKVAAFLAGVANSPHSPFMIAEGEGHTLAPIHGLAAVKKMYGPSSAAFMSALSACEPQEGVEHGTSTGSSVPYLRLLLYFQPIAI